MMSLTEYCVNVLNKHSIKVNVANYSNDSINLISNTLLDVLVDYLPLYISDKYPKDKIFKYVNLPSEMKDPTVNYRILTYPSKIDNILITEEFNFYHLGEDIYIVQYFCCNNKFVNELSILGMVINKRYVSYIVGLFNKNDNVIVLNKDFVEKESLEELYKVIRNVKVITKGEWNLLYHPCFELQREIFRHKILTENKF